MAVAAVDAVAGDVALVAELDGLLARDVRLGHPGRAIDFVEQAEQAGDEEDRAEDTDAGDGVGAAMKDLRHRSSESGLDRRGSRRGWSTMERVVGRRLSSLLFLIREGKGKERKETPNVRARCRPAPFLACMFDRGDTGRTIPARRWP